MNVKKKVWNQSDTVGGSRRQNILAVLMLKYIYWFSFCFTECSYLIIFVYQLNSVCHKLKDILWGLWCWGTSQSISRPLKLWGEERGGLKFDKNDPISSRFKDIRDRVSHVGIKCSDILWCFLFVLLSDFTKLFAFTNLIPSFTN